MFYAFCLLVIEQSSHKWTGTDSGTSVIWTWSNQPESVTRYMPALDCCLLTFDLENVIHVHLLFDYMRYFPDCSSVTSISLLFCG